VRPSRPAIVGEHLPTSRPQPERAAVEPPVQGDIDLDSVAAGAHLRFDASAPLMPAGRDDHAGDRRPGFADNLDIVRTEEEGRLAVGGAGGADADGPPRDLQMAVADTDGNGVRLADEAEHEGRVRRVVHLFRRSDLLDAPLAHDHDPVRELQGLFLVVGHEHRRVARLVVDLAQPPAQLLADLGVQGAEGFVEQENPRLDRQGARKGHPLTLSAGQLGRKPVFEPRQLHELQQLQHAIADGLPRRAAAAGPDAEPEGDVVEDRHVTEQGIVLENESDVAFPHGLGGRVLLAKEDGSCGRELQPGDEAQQGCLAGAGRAEQGDQLARADVQRHVVECREPVELFSDTDDSNVHERILIHQWRVAASRRPNRSSSSVFRARVSRASRARSEATAKAATKLYSL